MEQKRTFKDRWEDFKFDCKSKFNRLGCWCTEHKEFIVVILPVLISGSIELVKIVARNKNTGDERRLKENYIYDRSQGHYYELKRKPTSSEWQLIDHRKSESGELLGDILRDMRLLK